MRGPPITPPPSRSPSFHQFLKLALTKNPKKRPTAAKLLQVRGGGTGGLGGHRGFLGTPLTPPCPPLSTPSPPSPSRSTSASSCWIRPRAPGGGPPTRMMGTPR